MLCGDDPCPDVCPAVFELVAINFRTAGGTLVSWDLRAEFNDPLPYTFQLQVGSTGLNDADDWSNVGLPVENIYYGIDDQRRNYGTGEETFYRVVLETSAGTYYSTPVSAMATFGHQDWFVANAIIRQEMVRHRSSSSPGYLLKARTHGPRCTRCTSPVTEEVRDQNCPVCYGTGFVCGYYYPYPCVWADLSLRSRHERNRGINRNTQNDITIVSRMLAQPRLDENDVWVNRATDDRWYIHEVRSVAERRGIPLVSNVELRLAPASDIIYTLEIPQQVDAIWERIMRLL